MSTEAPVCSCTILISLSILGFRTTIIIAYACTAVYLSLSLPKKFMPYLEKQVKKFVSGYTALREMGFSSVNVADALFMYENDTNKALAHCLSGS